MRTKRPQQIKTKLSGNTGMTLVEIMVAVFIMVSITAGMYRLIEAAQENFATTAADTELKQSLRIAMDSMIQELRQTSSTSILDVPADDVWHSFITFQLPDTITNGSLVWKTATTKYYIDPYTGDKLIKFITSIAGNTNRIVAPAITNIQFRRSSANSAVLEVAMTASKKTFKGRTLTKSLSFNVKLRN